jgi:hypothetical protein
LSSVSEKYSALQQLLTLGVTTLTSFLVNGLNYSNILRQIDSHSEIDYWVVRASLGDKHLIERPAYATAELGSVFNSVFSRNPAIELMITELIPATRAGVFFKASDFVYCEYVPGALQSLVRDGVKPTRILLRLDGRIGLVEPNVPEFFYYWSGTDLKKQQAANADPISVIKKLLENLFVLVHSCPPLSIIEWVQSPAQHLYAIDFKKSANEFLSSYGDIHQGLLNGSLASLPDLWEGTAASAESGTRDAVMFIERPLYSYIKDGSAFSASRIALRSGGLLSHLIVECSRRLIPCLISPALFDLHQMDQG